MSLKVDCLTVDPHGEFVGSKMAKPVRKLVSSVLIDFGAD